MFNSDTIQPSVRAIHFLLASAQVFRFSNPHLLFQIASQSLSLSQSKAYKTGIGRSILLIAWANLSRAAYSAASHSASYLLADREFAAEHAGAYLILSAVQRFVSDSEAALHAARTALSLAREQKSKEYEAMSLINIALCQYQLKQTKSAYHGLQLVDELIAEKHLKIPNWAYQDIAEWALQAQNDEEALHNLQLAQSSALRYEAAALIKRNLQSILQWYVNASQASLDWLNWQDLSAYAHLPEYQILALLKAQLPVSEKLNGIEYLLGNCKFNSILRHSLSQILAQLYESLGDFQAALHYQKAAHALQRLRYEAGLRQQRQLLKSLDFSAARQPEPFSLITEDFHLSTKALENAAVAITISDTNGTILWANQAFSQLTAYSLDEVIGRNPSEILKSGLHEQSFYENLWKTILSGRVWRGEVTNRRRDKSIYQEIQSIAPIFNKEGLITNFVSVREDITEQKNEAKAWLAMELEHEKSHLLSDFIQNVSHEFRTPLSIIQTQLYLMKRKAEAQPSYESSIHEQIGRINRLVDRLVKMVRVDNGLVLHKRVLDLQGFLQQFISVYPFASEEFSADLSEAKLYLRADAHLLQESLEELLDNAFRFKSAEGHVCLSCHRLETMVVISVHNTGSYIPADELPRVFERFYRHDRAHSTDGFGLGLAIAQGIAHAHGGYISASSDTETGTDFALHLPLLE